MKAPSKLDHRTVLNRVLNLQRFSLANYLRYARPWAGEADHVLRTVVIGIAEAQSQNAIRVGELLIERHASVKPGTFPEGFTGLNDLSIRYVAPGVVDDLNRILNDLRACGDLLRNDGTAQELVQAIILDEERHAKILSEELQHVRQVESASRQATGTPERETRPVPAGATQSSSRRDHNKLETTIPA